MGLKIGIIADDLTGAADSVAPFALRGLSAGVGFALGARMVYKLENVSALALSTECRDLPPENALAISRRNRDAMRVLLRGEPEIVYKKIDSTLRGHLRQELDAVRQELPDRIALVCPAFPAQGRVVRQGGVVVHGVPLHTAFETAPEAAESLHELGGTVRAAFGMDGAAFAATLDMATVRQPVTAALESLEGCARAGADTLFFDAETDADLDVLAQIVLQAPERYLPVGSAGLAQAIAARLTFDAAGAAGNAHAAARGREIFRTHPVLVAVGSRNPVSRRQAAFLAERAGLAPVVASWQAAHGGKHAAVKAIRRRFEAGQRVALVTTPDAFQEKASLSCLAALFWYDAPANQSLPALIVTGGETLFQMFGDLSETVCGLRVAGEIAPGIVLGFLSACENRVSRQLHDLPIVLKAGGFGDDPLLARIIGLVP